MTKRITAVSLLLTVGLAAASTATAQPPVPQAVPVPAPSPAPAQAPAPAPKPEPRPTPTVTSTDAEVKAAVDAIVGSYKADALGTIPSLVMNTAVVNITGLDNAVYFEIARADSPWAPFRQGVVHFYKQQSGGKSELVMRVLDFVKSLPTFGSMVAGLWAAPEQFPTVTLDKLSVNSQIVLKNETGKFSGKSLAQPTLAAGATSFTTEIVLSKGSITWLDRGYDKAGTQVWGPADGQALAFKAATPAAKVTRRDNGLVMIDLFVPAEGEISQDGGEVAVNVTGWLWSDGLVIDNSRQPGREPLRQALPAKLPFQGINEGLSGMKVGQFRRLVIPPAMGFGATGRPRSNIPPNAYLVYELEGLWVRAPEGKKAAEGAAVPPAVQPDVVPPPPRPKATEPAPEKPI